MRRGAGDEVITNNTFVSLKLIVRIRINKGMGATFLKKIRILLKIVSYATIKIVALSVSTFYVSGRAT